MPTHRLLAVAAALVIPATAHADRVIDAFTDPLPTITVGSTSGQFIWAGKYDSTHTQPSQSASQSGLAHVYGGKRVTQVTETTLTDFVTVSMDVGDVSFSSGSGPTGSMTLEYGALTPLNLDLSGDLAFELGVEGDMSSGPRPIQLTIAVRSGSGPLISHTFPLINDGVYQFPFTAFPGVTFSDVDYLRLTFDGTAVNSVDLALLDGLRTTGCLQTNGTTGGARADVFIDSFLTPLPLRSLPGGAMANLVWAGRFNTASQVIDHATQSSIAGVLGGQRTTTVTASDLNNLITGNTSKIGVTPVFDYSTGNGTSGWLDLEYGASTPLHANLSTMKAFELEVDGDLNAGIPRPVPLTITVFSSTGSKAFTTSLLASGTYYIPFTSFPGTNFADVDYIKYDFDAHAVDAVDYELVGGLRASACIR